MSRVPDLVPDSYTGAAKVWTGNCVFYWAVFTYC